ncbi:MAG: CoA transferase [Microthrixaceae bacterium]
MPNSAPLTGVRVVECSMLGPAAITTHLADLGADVIKVESPSGDYIRRMTWPIVEGVSLMHLHINRGSVRWCSTCEPPTVPTCSASSSRTPTS